MHALIILTSKLSQQEVNHQYYSTDYGIRVSPEAKL